MNNHVDNARLFLGRSVHNYIITIIINEYLLLLNFCMNYYGVFKFLFKHFSPNRFIYTYETSSILVLISQLIFIIFCYIHNY